MPQRMQWMAITLLVWALAGAAVSGALAQEDQVSRGQAVYEQECAGCHDGGRGPDLDARTLTRYDTAQDLFNYIHTTMPYDEPGSLADEQYWDAAAYLLNSTGLFTAGTELTADNAASIVLNPEAAQDAGAEDAGPAPAGPEAGEAAEAGPDVQYIEPVDYAAVVGQLLWQELQAAGYAENWATLPGRDRLYPGTEPHGALLTTYLNPAAMEALESQPGELPVGSIIVKENYTPEEVLNGITVMQKQANYGAAYPYWVWASYAPDGAIQASGAVEGCISCHSQARANDYVFSFTVNPEAGN